jgi:hypothetical protein
MYARWPKKLRQLLYPSWNLQTIARNLYTIIAVVDPGSEAGMHILVSEYACV